MARLVGLLLACTGLVLAQEEKEGDDESGISIDEAPSGPEEEAKPDSESKPAARTTAFPARDPKAKVATVAVRKKGYSLAVPADWVLQDVNDEKSELAWDILLPGSSKRAELYLLRREDGGDPRSYPYYQAEWFRKEKPEEKTDVLTKPCPRLIVRRRLNETDWVDAYFCLSVRNNMFVLQLSCSAADFQQAETDMLATVRSFAAKVELWPPIPKGYETSDEGTWLIARAPNVTASLAPLVKTLKETEKRFRRDHGPLPKGDAPIVVLVHASKAQGGKIDPKVAESTVDFFDDPIARRLFAVPFVKENRDQEAHLAYSASRLLFGARYGDTRPNWVCSGEASVARSECYTRKPLPVLDEGFVAWLSTMNLHRLDGLEELRKSDGAAWGKECLFQVAALREGKYKKQYKAFLDDFAETGDGLGAFDRHLGTIDQGDILAAANQFISTRIKEEKRAK
jgi:hypothetical protein